MFKLSKYCCIKQMYDADCGIACIATVANQYGCKIDISQIANFISVDDHGVSAANLVGIADRIGFEAKVVRGNEESFFTPFPLPCIAHVARHGLTHYIVVHKIGNKLMIIADPSSGLKYYSIKKFFKIWSGIMIFIVPR